MQIILPIVMLAAFLLIVGAFVAWRRTGDIKHPVLMVILALVMIGNVWLWAAPTGQGGSLVDQADQAEEQAEDK